MVGVDELVARPVGVCRHEQTVRRQPRQQDAGVGTPGQRLGLACRDVRLLGRAEEQLADRFDQAVEGLAEEEVDDRLLGPTEGRTRRVGPVHGRQRPGSEHQGGRPPVGTRPELIDGIGGGGVEVVPDQLFRLLLVEAQLTGPDHRGVSVQLELEDREGEVATGGEEEPHTVGAGAQHGGQQADLARARAGARRPPRPGRVGCRPRRSSGARPARRAWSRPEASQPGGCARVCSRRRPPATRSRPRRRRRERSSTAPARPVSTPARARRTAGPSSPCRPDRR